ncbi:uncharacterized protein LOC143849484 [Tasmannia lanceolata]|uniref:uncharacterized protein LOC143849484 n=1 Tax=Tasmannia lanceolata TaxID=3420 RepID=UPI0040647CA6
MGATSILIASRSVSDVTKIEPFNGMFFKRWQQKILMILDISGVEYVLKTAKPIEGSEDYDKVLAEWTKADKLCKSMILNALSNELFDVFCGLTHAADIWIALLQKYVVEAAGIKKYAIGNFLKFNMSDNKDVSFQIHGFHLVVSELKREGMDLPEPFIVGALIEKLPESWIDYKNNMKHKRKDMSLEEVIVHIRIKEKNSSLINSDKAKELTSKANLVEDNNRKFGNKVGNKGKKYNNNNSHNKHDTRLKAVNSAVKKKKNCFVCGKPGHYAQQCRHKKSDQGGKPIANLVESDIIAAVLVSEANMVSGEKNWVVDSGATQHICANKSAFTSYTPMGEGEEQVFMGDSRPSPVVGKGKVLLKLTSGKTLVVTDVLHVPNIRQNLVSVSLLGKAGVKVAFESDKLVMTRNGNFVGKGYCNNGLFVLNISEIMNENASSSTYMPVLNYFNSSVNIVDCMDMWHAPKQRNDKFNGVFIDNGFDVNEADRCIYSKSTDNSVVIICLYVDDMLILGTDLLIINETKNFLSSNFDMKDMGEANVILGMKISKTKVGFTLSQPHYVEKILKRFNNFDVKPVSSPYDSSVKLVRNSGHSVSQSEYAQVIGNLMYLMNCTRPDIAYVVSRLSRYTQNPSKDHWDAITRVLKYLKGTVDYGLKFCGFPSVLEGYSDANWISDSDETKSKSGYVFTLGGSAVSWKFSKQTCTARSTVESEFIALEKTGSEAEWLRNLLSDIPL